MSLVIKHNMMAEAALRNLGASYRTLGESINALSSGLRIDSADDDAAVTCPHSMCQVLWEFLLPKAWGAKGRGNRALEQPTPSPRRTGPGSDTPARCAA